MRKYRLVREPTLEEINLATHVSKVVCARRRAPLSESDDWIQEITIDLVHNALPVYDSTRGSLFGFYYGCALHCFSTLMESYKRKQKLMRFEQLSILDGDADNEAYPIADKRLDEHETCVDQEQIELGELIWSKLHPAEKWILQHLCEDDVEKVKQTTVEWLSKYGVETSDVSKVRQRIYLMKRCSREELEGRDLQNCRRGSGLTKKTSQPDYVVYLNDLWKRIQRAERRITANKLKNVWKIGEE